MLRIGGYIMSFVLDSIQDCYEEFILSCETKNLSSRTIQYYQECYRLFSQVVDVEQSVTELNNRTIKRFTLHLQKNTSCNANSINARLRGIRTFLNYCYDMEYISKVKVPMLKTDGEQKEPYTKEEIVKLLTLNKNPSFTEYRNYCIVATFIATGMRLNTLINLKVSDLDFEDFTIKLTTTKNRKVQYIPMPKKLAVILSKYVRKVKPTSYLFTSRTGEQLSDNAVKIAIRKYNRRRGVESTSIHKFRHTFAKNYLMNGGDVFKLQKLLSHSTLDITKNYVNLYCIDLKEDMDSICML